MFKIAIYFIFGLSLFSTARGSEEGNWPLLYHAKNGISDVVTDAFFFTPNRSLELELKEFALLLNGIDGELFACQYPARYLLIKTKMKVPDYDLSNCKDLESFIESFNSDKVSLVMSSETMGSPSSAFGHLMLLFHSKSAPLASSYVVHFSAIHSGDDNFFTFANNGINGKYSGFFLRELFFKKMNEYNNIEQRYIHIYPLRFSKQQLSLLYFHLYELRKAEFRYFFLNKNCSNRIDELLSLVEGRQPDPVFMVSLPIRTLKRHAKYLGEPITLVPSSVQARLLIKKMSSNERSRYKQVLRGERFQDSELSDLTKETLFNFYNYKFRTQRIILPEYNRVQSFSFGENEILKSNASPLMKLGPTKFGFGYSVDSLTSDARILIRPLNNDLQDPQSDPAHETELVVMKLDLLVNNSRTQLVSFDFLSLKSLNKNFLYNRDLSWTFRSYLNRENEQNRLRYSTDFGSGYTNGLFSNGSVSHVLSLGHDTTKDETDFYAKQSETIISYITKSIKVGGGASYKLYPTTNYWDVASFMSYQIDSVLLVLNLQLLDSEVKNRLTLMANYTF